MLNKFLNALFPESCPVCDKPSLKHITAPVCGNCWQSITPYKGPICDKCGKPLLSEDSRICGDCLKDEPAFAYARSFGLYKEALRKGINQLKYHGKKRLAKPLAEILLQMEMPPADAVIPVPLHEKRLRQREFNQSALVAGHLAKGTGSHLILNCLRKIKDTAPQVGLSSSERIKNLRNAFQVDSKSMVTNKTVMLVDDVVTTGATIRECAKTLKKAGAGKIYVVSLAHGMSD